MHSPPRALPSLLLVVCLCAAGTASGQQPYDYSAHPRAGAIPEPSGPSGLAPGIGGNEFTVASSSGWPSTAGTHFHSEDGGSIPTPPDLMEVGECCEGTSQEEVRGLCEVDLSGQDRLVSALISFEVLQLGGLFDQPTGTFDIRVETYPANNVEEIADFGAPVAATVGTFSSGDLSVADIVSFDVTDAYNSAIASSDPALGVVLRPATGPQGAALVLGNCAVAPAAPTLPASWLTALTLVLLAAAAVRLRRRRGYH